MRPRLALAAVAIVIVVACGAQAPRAPEPGAATLPPADASAVLYTCGGRFSFGAGALGRTGSDEAADTAAAAALRAHLAKPDMDIEWLPDRGWMLVGQDATGAEFIAHGGETGLLSVNLDASGGTWRVTGWGGCRPMRVLPAGLGGATWDLAPGQAVGPSTMGFAALVTESACASGQSSAGRIVGPDILALADQVLVTFAVRPPGGGIQSCQSNPATPVTVSLPEPLGDRRLLDGSTLPPREPVPTP